MRVIHKYPLEVRDKQQIELPKDSEILTIQTQKGIPCLWALVQTENSKEVRTIHTFGTGNEINIDTDNLTYISTYQLHSGSFIFHTFLENR